MTQRKHLLRVDKVERNERKNDEINVVDDVNSDDECRRTKAIDHICSRLLLVNILFT